MRDGSLLYVEEINRIPEETLTTGQILVYQVPIPEPLRFLEPRLTARAPTRPFAPRAPATGPQPHGQDEGEHGRRRTPHGGGSTPRSTSRARTRSA